MILLTGKSRVKPYLPNICIASVVTYMAASGAYILAIADSLP